MTTGPALYEGTLRHRRFEGASHAFQMDVFYAYLDVATIDETLAPLPLWSSRRPSPIRFRRRDYLDGTARPFDDAVRELIDARTGRRPRGPIMLLTQLRTFGWLFNPLSVYFAFDEDGEQVDTIVLEVTSTPWHDRCWYVVTVEPTRPVGPWDLAKKMHVSPFLDLALTYRLRATAPGASFTMRLEDRRGPERVFAADLALHRVPLDRRHALVVPARHPLVTWRVSIGIYRNAFRLWRKGLPVHPHPRPSGADHTREVLR